MWWTIFPDPQLDALELQVDVKPEGGRGAVPAGESRAPLQSG
jgi:hypothetical protein